ncbi:MAG TPA: hypothetical protein VHR41_06900 [Gemmatimonadales bacterium]|jgi:hypothetical protein|nr:hypothetical protein [Gemmatimonadales bacterium]
MDSREFAATVSTPVLQNTVRNQRRPNARLRYEPTVVYQLAERARSRGVDLNAMQGPWRAGQRPLRAPGRNSLNAIPIVTNERTQVMVDTAEHAVDVAGLLNWCGVRDLDPVPDLVPPERARVH